MEIVANIAIAVITPILAYIVWLLKNQKKDRDANSQGTMMLLRVQLIEYHDKYMKLGKYRHTLTRTFARCTMRIMHLEEMEW